MADMGQPGRIVTLSRQIESCKDRYYNEPERLGLLTRYGDGRSTRYYPAMEGWARDNAKLGKASVRADDAR